MSIKIRETSSMQASPPLREEPLAQKPIVFQKTNTVCSYDLLPRVVPPSAPMASPALRARPLLLEASILDCLDAPRHEADGTTNASETPEIRVMTATSATHAADLQAVMFSGKGERRRDRVEQSWFLDQEDSNAPVSQPRCCSQRRRGSYLQMVL